MSYIIERELLKKDSIAGQRIVYTLNSDKANNVLYFKYKYLAQIYIGNTGAATNIVATLKFSPNSTGYGIVDISNIIEQYVKSDNLGQQILGSASRFKNVAFNSGTTPHPIHLIDKLCLNTNLLTNFIVVFGEEYSLTSTGAVFQYGAGNSGIGKLFNATDYGEEQLQVAGDYGVDLANWNKKAYINYSGAPLSSQNFLTNAPINSQYIGDNDYSTLAFCSGFWQGFACKPYQAKITWYINGVYDDEDTLDISDANGGFNGTTATANTNTQKEIQYLGVGPANFKNRGAWAVANWTSYTIQLLDSTGDEAVTPAMEYIRKDADCKGYDKIRLTWLNKFGVWDYYNFTKKNFNSTNIDSSEFKGVVGNWDSGIYTQDGYDRGRAVLNTKATQVINCNSDWFTSDTEAAWIEELFISNEVYILNEYDVTDAGTNGAEYGKYITPVIVTSKKYERYTEANDKVAQYEIEVEYAHNKRIQRA